MKKGLTEIVFLIDRSGSMGGAESDTIGGFNAFLDKQKKEEGTGLVSTVLFDNYTEIIHDRTALDKIAPLTEKEYYVRGSTALLDALGSSIEHISKIHKYAREEDRPEHTIFVITTDGLENASRSYSYEQVSRMVSEKEKEYGWQFVFLGAGIDAVKEARRYGISRDNAVTFAKDRKGMELQFSAVAQAVSNVRKSGKVSPDWKTAVEEDMKNRE